MGFIGQYDPFDFCETTFQVSKSIEIPTCDESAWLYYPKYRHVYNKMWVCETQGISHAPYGILPPSYPVFYKPIINLDGMGKNSFLIEKQKHFDSVENIPGFWMEYLQGDHISHDLVVDSGKIFFYHSMIGIPSGRGKFSYWKPEETSKELKNYLKKWIKSNLPDYRGCLNIETIDGKIIECHLRLGDSLSMGNPDLIRSLFYFFRTGKMRDVQMPNKFLVPIFVSEQEFNENSKKGVFKFNAGQELMCERVEFVYRDKLKEQNGGGIRVAIVRDSNLSKALQFRQSFINSIYRI